MPNFISYRENKQNKNLTFETYDLFMVFRIIRKSSNDCKTTDQLNQYKEKKRTIESQNDTFS